MARSPRTSAKREQDEFLPGLQTAEPLLDLGIAGIGGEFEKAARVATRVLFEDTLLPIVTGGTRMERRGRLSGVANAVEHVLRRPSPVAGLVERFGEAVDHVVRQALANDEIEAGIGDR